MATIAEMLIQQAPEAQKAPDISGAINQGAQLAQHINQTQMQRAQLEQQKQQLQMQKAIAVTDTLKIAANTKDPKLKNFLLKNVMPGKIKALGMEEFFGPQTLEMVATSDEAMQKVLGLQLKLEDQVNKGEITGAQAYETARGILNNPEELAMLDTDRLFEAQKFSVAEGGKEQRAQLVGQMSLGKQMQAQAAAPRVAEATEKARGRVKFKAEEEATGINAIQSLEDVLSKVENPGASGVRTGKISQAIPGLRSDAVQSVLSPETVAAKTQAQSALNTILRQTLGAQFTQQEGERVLSQIGDDKQPNEENARRIKNKIKELRSALDAKAKSLGTSTQGIPSAKNLSPDGQRRAAEGVAKKLNITVEEARKRLGL